MNSSLTPLSKPSRGRLSWRARACCSDKIFMPRFAFGNTSSASEKQLPSLQPLGCAVFGRGNVGGTIQCLAGQSFLFASPGKNLGEVGAKTWRQIRELNAALVKK